MNAKERKWAARDAADERRGNIPPKPQEITQTCQCDQLRLDFDAAIRERDKARREACERTAENLSLLGSSVRLSTLRVEHAARRGWDCFKSDHIGGTNEMAPDE